MSNNLSRRRFLAGSAAVSGGMVLGIPGAQAKDKKPVHYDLDADIVIVGAGATGIPAAIGAAERGYKVLVVDANYDIGGHAMVSMGNTALGGGNAMQKKYGIKDSPEQVFKDLTDWSVTLPNGFPDYRFNDREQMYALAQNSVPTYDFLVAHGVPFLDQAPDNKGANGIGCSVPRELHFAWTKGACAESPIGRPGAVLMRSMEDAARKAGVKFLLNYYMDELIQEEGKDGKSGKVIGIKAHYEPRLLPDGKRLESFRSDGNIDLTTKNIAIHAHKAVVLATAGYTANVNLRRIIDPRLTKEYATAGEIYSHQDGSGTMAGINVGAALWGTSNAVTERPCSMTRGAVIGVWDTYMAWPTKSPLFPIVGHSGVKLRNWQNAIVVNQVGKRFFDETCSGVKYDGTSTYDTPNSVRGLINPTNATMFKDRDVNPYVQGNYKNVARNPYRPNDFLAAALQINEGSKAPDWSAGPQWAIFDAEAVRRERMHTDSKSVDPQFFFKADTIEELAEKINTNPHQSYKMDPKVLAQTVARYNEFVAKGEDPDFEKPKPQYAIAKGPFYAAWSSVTLHDCYCGLHIDSKCRVLDWEGNVIPGLWAGGEVTGGSSQHGLARGLIHAYIMSQAF